MSNLSELLPTGGGQNAVDFVATGTLASGQTVALKSDGTVEAVAASASSVGSAVVFETGAVQYIAATFDSANNKVVIVCRDVGNSKYGTAVVGTVSGTSISFGSPVVFESASVAWISSTYDSTNAKVIIAYVDEGNSDYGTVVVGTVSGTSISFGTAVVFQSAASPSISATYDSTNSKIVIAYRNAGNSYNATGIVGTVSGTSISFGTAVSFATASIPFLSATYHSANEKVVIAYTDDNNSNYGKAIVGTVSGTSISFGTAVVFETSNSQLLNAIYDSVNQKVIILYMDGGDSDKGKAVIGTVSGTSISFGSAITFSSAAVSHLSAAYSAASSSVIASYRIAPQAYGTVISGVTSASNISFGSALTFTTDATQWTASVYDSNAAKYVIAYMNDDTSDRGEAVVFTDASSNNTSFIGITAEAISNTATGAINTYGGINTAQTGLTIASDYYVQADGSLSTTTSTVKAGQAISATTINMKDLT